MDDAIVVDDVDEDLEANKRHSINIIAESEEENVEEDILLEDHRRKKTEKQMKKRIKKMRKKRKESKSENARFDCTFFFRFLRIFCCHFNFFSCTQIFLLVLVLCSSISDSLLSYASTSLKADMYVHFAHLDYPTIWQSIMFLAMFNVIQGFCSLFTNTSQTLFNYFWRKNLTFSLLRKYFQNNNYYEILHLKDHSIDNPDQRIQSDADDLCSDSSEVWVGIIKAMINIIWNTAVVIQKKCYWLLIPIYIFPIVDIIFYSCLFGPVAKRVFIKDKYEGYFRFRHSSIRENSESIAFFYPKSEESEKRNCSRSFSAVLKAWTCLIFWSFPIYVWGLAHRLIPYSFYLLTILILVFGDFYPFDQNMTSDQRIKTVSLFYLVARSCGDSISDLFDLSQQVSSVVGNTARVGQLQEAYDAIEKKTKKKNSIRRSGVRKEGYVLDCDIDDDDDPEIRFENVTIVSPKDKELIRNINFNMKPGDHTIIMGPSGVGKSSILRTAAGLWSFEKGVIRRPRDGVFFLPQRPYLIHASLRANIVYPYESDRVTCSDEELRLCMEKAGIGYLLKRASLHQKYVKWDEKLSLGEMQRVAIARCLFHRPTFALLDESTSALDEDCQEICYQSIIKSGITCLSIAHRDTVQKYHHQIMRIDSDGGYTVEIIDRSKIPIYDINWKTIRRKELRDDEKYQMIRESTPGEGGYLDEEDEEEFSRGRRDDLEEKELLPDEYDDKRGSGHSGFNLHFLKRVFRLVCCCIMIRRCCFVVYLVFSFLFNMISSGVTLPLFLLATKVLGAICDKDTAFGTIAIIMYFVLFSLVSLAWGTNTVLWDFMEMRIRRNITVKMQDAYFKNRNSYKINVLEKSFDNFDQRCCNDAANLAHNLRSILNTGTEAGMMTLMIVIAGTIKAGPTLPLFVVIVALLSGAVQIFFMIMIAKKRFLVMKREGYFRTSLTRMKEYSEQISFYNGKDCEKEIVEEKFRRMMSANLSYSIFKALNKSFSEWVNNVCGSLSYVIILLSLQWGYLDFEHAGTKEIVAGVQQVAYYFGSALKFFKQVLDEGNDIGTFSGNVARVSQALEIMDEMNDKWRKDEDARIKTDDFIGVENLTVQTPKDGKKLILGLNFRIQQNENLLIRGPSGCGKSSLLRVISGLWNSSKNSKIFCPEIEEDGNFPIYFLPQRAYLCLGSLIQNVVYPETYDWKNLTVEMLEEVEEVLQKVNLGYLRTRLLSEEEEIKGGDEKVYLYMRKNWSTILSPGEQQRLAVARVVYHKVKFCFMDESTSALDIENEEMVYRLCLENNITFLSVGHRSSIVQFHNRMLEIDGEGGWRFAEMINCEEEVFEI